MAQDDYYYEIQLTNKQLVFYFMAGATGLVLSFLAGVMVGKGVDASAGDVQAARPVVEEKVVAEEPLARPTTPPPAEDLTYAQRLEGDKPDDAALDKGRPAAAPSTKAVKPTPTPTPKAVATPKPATTTAPRPSPTPETRVADAGAPPAPSVGPRPEAATVKSAAKPAPSAAAPKSAVPSFTIQVGAFKDKATADSVVTRLKSKGFAAYLIAPESDGSALFNVRVGSYPARADAERVQTKLRDQEKFKPFIVKN